MPKQYLNMYTREARMQINTVLKGMNANNSCTQINTVLKGTPANNDCTGEFA